MNSNEHFTKKKNVIIYSPILNPYDFIQQCHKLKIFPSTDAFKYAVSKQVMSGLMSILTKKQQHTGKKKEGVFID